MTSRTSVSPWTVLSVALFGLFSVGFTITLLAVSLDIISKDLHSSPLTLTWVITGPLLAFGVVGPVAGKAGDLWGHKRVYLIGIGGATIFALGTAGAWDATSLIAFRILGAAAGSACGPVSMAMINSVFPTHARPRAMGYWSMVVAGGPVLGVVAGGPIVEAFSWRWVFVGQIPLGALAFMLAAWVLPASIKQSTEGSASKGSDEASGRVPFWVTFDIPGALLLAGGVTGALVALNRASVWGWTNPLVVGGFGVGVIALMGFVKQEGRAKYPLINLAYFRDRNVASPTLTQLLANFSYMGGFIITPFFLADAFGYGPTRIGLISISRPLAFAIAGPLGGLLAVRVGARRAGMVGASMVMASMLGLALVHPGMSDLFVMAALALSGIGLGLMSPAMVATVANAVSAGDLGIVGATQQLAVQVGVVAGIQFLQTTQAGLLDHVGLVSSYHWAYLLGAVVAGASILSASFISASPFSSGSTFSSGEATMPPLPTGDSLSS
ncbi:MAG: MFS transporter [Acidimicrobiales bacterium]